MAIRNIRTDGDEILRKVSKKIDSVDKKIVQLLKDMAETMYDANGVGLAAVQIGILKRIVVIDIGDGLIELINPEIISTEGEQHEVEGCLSVPGVYAEVIRPETVKIKALNTQGEEIEIVGTGFLAIAICHELDHLDGFLFKDKAVRFIDKNELERERK